MEEAVYKHKWKKFFSYYKPYLKTFFMDMFCALIVAAVSLVTPLIVRYITGTVIYFDPDVALQYIIRLAGVMILLTLLQAAGNYYITYAGHVMGAKMEYDMRNEIFSHYQKLSFNFFDNQKTGQLMSRITNDLFDITELFHHGPEDIVISIIKFLGSFIILLCINWKMALASFAFIPIMVVYAYVYNKKMKSAFKMNRVKIAEINAGIEDNLSGIRVVKSFANEDIEMEKFRVGNNGFLASKRNSYRYMGGYHTGLNAFINMITIAVVVAGGILLTHNAATITDIITFCLYIGNYTEPVQKLISFTEQFQNGITGYERFLEIISEEPDIVDKEDALEPETLNGNIVFDDVSFKYIDGTGEVFSHVNINISKGEYVALVGNSGVGKTTLCSLIPRFYDVSEGAVRIDGTDIRDIKLKNLRQNIGIVQQDVYLFTGTVIDNIRYGRPDATDEEIIEAAKEANAHEFIMELPDKYNTYIGQRGVKLSGGQKQRLSIARAFLKNPPILILDEATSALDNESEKVVQDSLEKLTKDRTTLVIAHRLSTIKNAERILVLTENGIEEEGTHKELLEKGGIYANLYSLAF